MKKNIVFVVVCICSIVLFSGCKQDRWYDWKVQNQLWLEENKKNEGVIVSHTGLQYKVIYQGTEADRKPNSTSYVTVDYTGRLIDGTVFENQVLSGYMTTFIQGWVEGLCKMNLNGDYILYIPYDLGYGEDGTGSEGYEGYIPPYSTLIFEVHLSDIVN